MKEQVVFVHDCSNKEVQEVPYHEFEKPLDVKVPGMSKKNTISARYNHQSYLRNLVIR